MRSDVLVKLELLDNKHGANDIRFHPVAVLLYFPMLFYAVTVLIWIDIPAPS